nr:hypothetical protein CFP56_32791 [Quercus suber]
MKNHSKGYVGYKIFCRHSFPSQCRRNVCTIKYLTVGMPVIVACIPALLSWCLAANVPAITSLAPHNQFD